MGFVAGRARPGDVLITSSALLAKHYGPPLPLYFLNNADLETILREKLFDAQGRPVEYAGGTPIIPDLPALQEVVRQHPSGWFVTERFRFDLSPAFTQEIRSYIKSTFSSEDVPSAGDMVIWRWRRAEIPSG
jgi:hypothetical protein